MSNHSQRPPGRRLVVGITGRIGAGKTSAGMYLSTQHNFQYIRYSQILSEWLAKNPESKSHLQDIGWEVMTEGRQEELNRRLIERITPDSNVAVDGLRHPLDYISLKDSFGSSFHLIFIDTPQELRWNRKKGDRYRSLAMFKAADSHPVEQHIASLQVHAGLVLQNNGSLQDLFSVLDEYIERQR